MPSCVWCGVEFERPSPKGPEPFYCSTCHRQRAYESRFGQKQRDDEINRLRATITALLAVPDEVMAEDGGGPAWIYNEIRSRMAAVVGGES